MCIIIRKPVGATLRLSALLRSYQRNNDGWGLAARTPDGLDIRRGFGRDADETLLDAFDELRQHDLTIHCRIGTSGKLGLLNTHPFQVRDGVWMFHNGVLNIPRPEQDYCDSYHAAKLLAEVIGPNPLEALADPAYRATLEAWAGTSRLAFVSESGVVVLNESLGTWADDGCWYSNDSATPDSLRGWYRDLKDDDAAADLDEETDDIPYSDYVPRVHRVRTQRDEDDLFAATLVLQQELQDADVDEITEACVYDPELAAELIAHLLATASVSAGHYAAAHGMTTRERNLA